MVLRIHGMDEVGVRFSLGPQHKKKKKASRFGRLLCPDLFSVSGHVVQDVGRCSKEHDQKSCQSGKYAGHKYRNHND